MPDTHSHRESFRLKRWIQLSKLNWFSGDHHVHAAGCGHYESPTEGVKPEDMWRHILGEDLDVGCVLSWGPCWYAQKQFFDGKIHPLSTSEYLMRYDIEVSGFPVVACRPSLPVAAQGRRLSGHDADRGMAELGPAGPQVGQVARGRRRVLALGMGPQDARTTSSRRTRSRRSTASGPTSTSSTWFTTPSISSRPSTRRPPGSSISGITRSTAGTGPRSPARPTSPASTANASAWAASTSSCADGQLDFDAWCEGIKQGRSYVSDGRSHLIDFQVNDLGVGESGGELKLDAPATVKVTAQAAAYLDPRPSAEARAIHDRPLAQKPYWDLERARIGETRKVPVEVIVNGESVGKTELSADGSIQGVSFDVPIKKSSWVALAGLPVVPHQPGLHLGRRQADPGLEEIRGMVPEIGRPVLVEEGAGHSRRAKRKRPEKPMKSPARLTGRSWRRAREGINPRGVAARNAGRLATASTSSQVFLGAD